MDYESSSDDDEIIIASRLPPVDNQNGWELCSNNNNDSSISRNQFCAGQYGQIAMNADHKEAVNHLSKTRTGEILFGSGGHGNGIVVTDDGGAKDNRQVHTEAEIQRIQSGPSKAKTERHISNGSALIHLNKSRPLRKNNTFPLFEGLERNVWLDQNDLPQENATKIGKRLLPPINGMTIKRNRVFSDTEVVIGTAAQSTLPRIDGSPGKIRNLREDSSDEDDRVQFQVGDDEYVTAVDTSTSSDGEVTSSSSDEKEISSSGAGCNIISDHLQTKFQTVLGLTGLRRSPTSSICSAPPFQHRKDVSSSDEDDNKSTYSDSKMIRTHSFGKRKRLSNHRRGADPEELSIHLHSSNFMDDLKHDETQTPRDMLGSDLADFEADTISETASTRSTGILPAIASHGIRERNFLVGNLTKHGSLLGADELGRYFPDRQLRLYVGTWNMQRKGIPRNLNDFILPKHEEYLRDMYVIGVQESTQDQKKWEIRLQETLGPNHVLAHSVSHGVLHMSIFIRRDLIWFCSPFEEDRVTTRMVSQIKTKGAVAISFQFFGTSMIFVTSHFHSGETRIKERVEDYNRIKEKLKLPKQTMCNTYKGLPNDVTTRFDCTFWFGDLNFRVSQPHQLMHQEVKNPEKYDFKEVLKGDQLTATKRRGRIFCDFTEPKIQFLPTYKFNPGTDDYDTSPKLRVPSYTDRILYKTREKEMVTCTRYDSVASLKKSDHRPVYGLFEVSLKPGRDSIPLGGGRFRRDVYEKAARLRAQQGTYQTNSAVCAIL